MQTNAGLTLKETPAPQMPPDTGSSRETNNSIKFPACGSCSGEAVSMEHLPAAPLCVRWENQSHRFFLWDAQLLSTVLPNPLGSWAAFPRINDKEPGTETRCTLESSWWLKVWATGWFSKHLANELPAGSGED